MSAETETTAPEVPRLPRFFPRAPLFFLPAASASPKAPPEARGSEGPTLSLFSVGTLPRAATTIAAPTPSPAAAETATVTAALQTRSRPPPSVSLRSANASPSRKLGAYPHSAPSRNGRPRVASAAAASPSGTHAQSFSVARGDTAIGVASVVSTPSKPLPRSNRETNPSRSRSTLLSPSSLSTSRRGGAFESASRVGPGSAYKPPACAPTKIFSTRPPPSPRRALPPAPLPSNADRGTDGNVRDHLSGSVCSELFASTSRIIVNAFPLPKRSVGRTSSKAEEAGSRLEAARRATSVAAPPAAGAVRGCTSPYVTFQRSAPVFASTERTLYSVRPTNTAPRSSGEDASSAAAASSANTSTSPSSSPPSPGAACITTPSAVNVRSSVPRSASSANTTLVRVPSTSAPSRVMEGDASTSCLAVTGRRATAALVSSPRAFGDSEESAYSAPSTPGNTTAGPPRVDRSATASVSSSGAWSHSPRAGRACARTSGPPDEKLHNDSPVARSTACTVPSRRDTSNGEPAACASRSPLARVASAATHATRSAHAASRRRMPDTAPIGRRRGDFCHEALAPRAFFLGDFGRGIQKLPEIAIGSGSKPTRAARYFFHSHTKLKTVRELEDRPRGTGKWPPIGRGDTVFPFGFRAKGAFACPSRS